MMKRMNKQAASLLLAAVVAAAVPAVVSASGANLTELVSGVAATTRAQAAEMILNAIEYVTLLHINLQRLHPKTLQGV
ncbi:hypothetical protein FHS16_005960 [Paenibacillus endophyticus]|uniref:Uncharacterized protein n=1 Tax=Paenibacillus endophyticus TaxID=1294268 RepID=A0A7W5GCW9_9BACL|nr:hypothetical protein [Paenibacillus endophyticus]MBB3155844.1 hypothetical protein [Paenibacillus endophyticus]